MRPALTLLDPASHLKQTDTCAVCGKPFLVGDIPMLSIIAEFATPKGAWVTVLAHHTCLYPTQ